MTLARLGKLTGKAFELWRTLRFIVTHPLNKKRKLASLRRFAFWQISSRLAPGPIAISFVNESKLLVSPSMTGATGNIYVGLHEFEDMSFVLHALRACDVFVDVGANIGSYTILAGAVVGARCIAFEPIPETYHHLTRNINLNGISAITVAENIGIGSKDGELRFSAGLDTINHVLGVGEGYEGGVAVPVKTLDHALNDIHPAMVKIDVEGFETEVIQGALQILERGSLLAIIMELNNSGDRYGFNEISLHERMLRYDFKPYAYSPFNRALLLLNGTNTRSGNTIYIKDVERVRRRLESASPFIVIGQSV